MNPTPFWREYLTSQGGLLPHTPQRPSCKKSLYVDSDGVCPLRELLFLPLREQRPGEEARTRRGQHPGVSPGSPRSGMGCSGQAWCLVCGSYIRKENYQETRY